MQSLQSLQYVQCIERSYDPRPQQEVLYMSEQKPRFVQFSDEEWARVKHAAVDERLHAGDIVRKAVRRYLEQPDAPRRA